MNCPNCNAPIQPGAAFCVKCGAPAPKPSPVYAPKQKSNGGLIAAIIIISVLIVCILAVTITFICVRRGSTSILLSEPAYSAPIFNSAVGSSTRSYDIEDRTGNVIYYYDEYAIDKNMNTAWTPNRNTDPIPSITLYANGKQTVRGIRMTNGYCKSTETYTKNKRIAKVRVTYAGGEVIQSFAADHYREMLDVPFTSVAKTDYITIQVLDTYYGKWNDIAISEIEVY